MKKIIVLWTLLVLLCASHWSFGQGQSLNFKMEGTDPKTILWNETYADSTEIFPFDKNINRTYGVAVNATIHVLDPANYSVHLILVDEYFNEYLIYECYDLLEEDETIAVSELCEETCILNGVRPHSVKVELQNAEITIGSFSYATGVKAGWDIEKIGKEKKQARDKEKIEKINANLKSRGQHWIAGQTSVSEMSYSDRKKLYGQSTFPGGFEFYCGGVISAGVQTNSGDILKSATISSPYVDDWDWRDRHGKNWVSPVTNQGVCGSCWAFAATGATEAMVNLYYNQLLNLDLSEQYLLSCSGAGNCDGGLPSWALDFIKTSGIVDEATFPYSATDESCSNKGINPSEIIKIGGREDFGSTTYPKAADDLKRMLIKNGVISSGLRDWAHAMVLVGYKVVKEGDVFYYRDTEWNRYWKTITAGDPLIEKTVWIFKNSWGKYFGDAGYVYVETAIPNIDWTHSIKTPISSSVKNYDVIYEDKDGDGYYWWGLGPKPANCPGPDLADGNDADPTLGPLDDFGHCILLGSLPVANFTAENISVVEGGYINFTDLSENSLTRIWTFEGGNPASSASGNPSVQYNTPGKYDVSLTVFNNDKTDSKTIMGYINVNQYIPEYCESKGSALNEWIGAVNFGSQQNVSGSSGSAGYQDFTGNFIYNVDAGATVSFALTPDFSSSALAETWRIWIDYNGDKDFDDVGELIYTSPLSTGVVRNVTVIPSGLNITTRMRVSMKRNSGPSQCEIFPYGEVEDYTIKIGGGVTQAPVANFTASTTQITSGKSVTFSDASNNNPASWAWTFEGGTPASSGLQNPIVTYPSSGIFNVTLTVTNNDGSNTSTKLDYITVKDPVLLPAANFSASKTTISEGEAVTFSDLSSNNPTSWEWIFLGGTPSSSTLKNPTVIYSNVNNFAVTLNVTNSAGSDTKTVVDYIHVNPSIPAYCTSSGNAANEWISMVQMGNNSNSSGAEGYADYTSKTFNFTSGEFYNISLTPEFRSKNSFEYWAVWIDFNGDMDFDDQGEQVFSASRQRSSVSGSIFIPADAVKTGTKMRVSMGRSEPASCGDIGSGEVEDYTVVISDPVELPPVAEFTSSKTNTEIGETIQFADLSDNSPTKWLWSFPGGNPASSNAKNPIVSYDVPGEYDVALEVSKPGFDSSKKIKQKYITATNIVLYDYCIPNMINSSSNYIKSVMVGNVINNASAGNGYSLTQISSLLKSGQSYSTTLVPSGSSTRNSWKIWIDFNNDSDFDDFDETVLSLNNKRGTVDASIVIPSYVSGSLRMRILMKAGNASSPCDDGFDGEVEDYQISIAPGGPQQSMVSSNLSEFATGIQVFPNPVEEILTLRVDNFDSGDYYTFFNSNGEIVTSDVIAGPLTDIDLSGVASGVYFMAIINKENVRYEKVIKR